MRVIALVITFVLLAISSLSAQQAATPEQQYPYGLNPYKPSDAWWLRTFGSGLVGSTPFSQLRKLDPYVPSQAELLRQVGAAQPWWNIWVGVYNMPSPTPEIFPGSGSAALQPTSDGVLAARSHVIIITPNNRLAPPRAPDERFHLPAPLPRRQHPGGSPLLVADDATKVASASESQTQFYVIPGCYAGNRPPASNLKCGN